MVDMSAVLGAAQEGATPIPNAYAQSQLQQAQAGYYGAEAQRTQTQNQALQYQNQMARYQFQRQQGFMQAWSQYEQNPSVAGLRHINSLYPDMVEQAQKLHAADSDNMKQYRQTTLGSVAMQANAGDGEGAAALLKPELDAATAAGVPADPVHQQMYDDLMSGDKTRIKQAGARAAGVFATTIDPKDWGNLTALGLSQAPITLKPGETAVNQMTNARTVVPNELKTDVVTDAAGNGRVVTTDPNPQGYGSTPGGLSGMPGAAPAMGATALPAGVQPGAGAAPPDAPHGGIGNAAFQGALGHVFKNEGGFAKRDMNGAPVNFGINQGANPGVDVSKLTKDQAAQIYKTKYWDPSGAEKLPPNMQAPYFDAYIRNPGMAKRALAQSGGDPNKFMDLTSAFFNRLAAKPGNERYQHAYAVREAENRAIATGAVPPPGMAAGDAPGAGGPPAAPQASVSPAGDYMGPAVGSNPVHDTGASSTAVPLTKGADTSMHWGRASDGENPGQEYPNKGGLEDPKTYKDVLPAVVDKAIVTGEDPTVGRGAGFRAAFYPARSARLKELNLTEQDLPVIQQKYKAIGGALQQNEAMLSMLQPNLQTMDQYIGQVKGWHQKLVQLGVLSDTSPAVNQAKIAWVEHFGSSAQKDALQHYRTSINSLTSDYVKLTTTNTGGGNTPSTDSAQAHARQFVDEDMPTSTLGGTLPQMLTEGQIKVKSVLDQKNGLISDLRNLLPQPKGGSAPVAGGQSAGHPALPQGATFVGTHNGKKVYELPGPAHRRVMEQ